MIAHMSMKMERVLHPIADIAIITPTELDHLVAEDGIGMPGDHPLEHIVVVELAGHPAGALRLRPIADFDCVGDDFEGTVFAAVIPVSGRRIRGRQASLNEADWVGPDAELAIPRVGANRTCGSPHPALGQELTPSPTARRAQACSGVRAQSATNRSDRGAACPDEPPTEANQPQTHCTASCLTPIQPVG
jgi:hypothetical protein